MSSLEELYQLLNVDGVDIDTIELAESLWLSQYISKTVVTSSIDIDTSAIPDNKPLKQNNNSSTTENESPKNTQKEKQYNQQKRKDAPLHATSDENSKNSLPFRTPLVRKLYKDNDLIYAFRHFRQKIVSLEQLKLDEEKIADYMAKTDIFRPFYKNSYEKRFNILFMIDISESMKIWKNLIEEFVKDIKNYHIFKKVTVYYISADYDTPKLFKKKERISEVNSKWYKHTEKNTLTFIFSDMVAKSWSSGELLIEITQWQRYLHLAIVQMLPQRLWNSTKLIDASMGKMSNSKKFSLNNKLQSRMEEILAAEEDSLPELVKIPILNFNESSIDVYGRVINALSNNRIEGALFDREDFQGEYQFSESNINIEAKDRLRNFYKYASTTSKELLELLAIVPLNLPIIKLVQQKLLPQSSQEHLSEVFMSSIIDKEQKIDGFYQFNKVTNGQNGVREELIKKIGAKKAFQTIVKLSEIIHSQGGIFDFLAYVVDPTTLKQSNEFNEIDREFARISVIVLNEMGGKYKELADRLQEGYIYKDNMSIIHNIKIKLVSKPLKSIRLVGVGGGGNNLINFMIQQGSYNNIDLIAVDTDAALLDVSSAPYKIQIGVELVKGLDAGMKPSIGKESALESYDEIRTALIGADIVFISASLGGGTGTGATPVIAQIAKEIGALTILIVTKPFTFEGKKRLKLAEDGLQELKKESDSIVVFPNDKLLSIIDKKLGLKESFKIVDSILAQAVSGISGVILSSGENDINLDFADLQTVMSHKGIALMGVGEYEGENAAYEAIKDAIKSPLLDNMSINGALGVLVHFKVHPNFPMIEISEALIVVQESAHEDADVIFGTTTDESLPENYIKITIIATGFEHYERFDEVEKLVIKNLITSGWDKNDISMNTKFHIDILLKYKNETIAVIELKSQKNRLKEGLEKAIANAKKLNIPFAFATNGEKIYEYNLMTLQESILTSFPSPNLLQRMIDNDQLVSHRGISKKNITNKILWVDDRPDNNKSERRMFEKKGITFDLALSTNEALGYLKDNKYLAIISDMGRKEGPQEGYVLLDKLRAIDKNIPLFFYAGSNLEEHKKMAKERGAQGSTNDGGELHKMVMNLLQKNEDSFVEENNKTNNITSDISFECIECGTEYFTECTELDWEHVGGSERGMGVEVEYEAQFYETCNKCNNDMSITFSCWEYPVGIENHRSVSGEGIKNLKGDCCQEFNSSGEEYTEDYGELMVDNDTFYSTFEEKKEELEIFLENLIPYAELEYRYEPNSIFKDIEVPSNNFLISREFDDRHLHDLIDEINEDISDIKLAIYEDVKNDNILLLKKQYKIESSYVSEAYGVDIDCNVFLKDNEQILYIYPYASETELEQGTGLDIDKAEVEMEMEKWFYKNYYDPGDFLPYETREGGYQYLYGGPYELDEVLYNQFGNEYPDEYIQQVVEDLESKHGDIAWVKVKQEEVNGLKTSFNAIGHLSVQDKELIKYIQEQNWNKYIKLTELTKNMSKKFNRNRNEIVKQLYALGFLIKKDPNQKETDSNLIIDDTILNKFITMNIDM